MRNRLQTLNSDVLLTPICLATAIAGFNQRRWLGNGPSQRNSNKSKLMSDNVIRVPSRSLKEQFSRSSEAWKEQSDPIFRFWAEGDWWGFPFFSLSASRYFGDKETLCLYWPLGTVVIAGPKVLDFYAGFCGHRATCLKPDGKDITDLKLILSGDSNAPNESDHLK